MKSKPEKPKMQDAPEGEYDIKAYLKKELLKENRADGKIEESSLEIQRSCRLRYFGGKPWRWEVGFKLKNNGSNAEYYRALLTLPPHIKLIGIIELTRRFTGEESSDLTYLAPPELVAEKRWQEYGSEPCLDYQEEQEEKKE